MSNEDLEKESVNADTPAQLEHEFDAASDLASTTHERPVNKKKKAAPQAAASAAVSGNAVDDVYLSQCVYKNKFARKSLTVHHVQRLVEWGYVHAGSDKDGWYGDSTAFAVAAFQADHSLDGAGTMNAATLVALFEGDHNVNVIA